MKISLTKTELGALIQRSLVQMTAFLPEAPEFRDILINGDRVVLFLDEDVPAPLTGGTSQAQLTPVEGPNTVTEEEAPKPARKPRQSRKAAVEAAPEPETTSEPEEEEAPPAEPVTDEDDIPFGLTPEEETVPEEDAPEEDENTVKAPTPDLKSLIAESKKAEASQEKPEDFLPPGGSDADDAPVKPVTPKGGLFAHLKR